MLHTTRDAIIPNVFDENSASAASKWPASNSMPGQALVPNLNQRLSWHLQPQQPLTSPMTSEAGTGGYPHGMTQPHQMPLGGHLGGHGKKKRGRPPGSKNKIKVTATKRNVSNLKSDIPKLGLPKKIQRKDASENDGDTSGQAIPTQGPEGQEMTFGGSILPQGGSILPQGGSQLMPHHNHFDQGGQTNYDLYASLQYQASKAAGLDNAAHAAGAPTEWPPNHSPAPIHVNYITNSNVIHNYRPPAHPVHAYYPTQ